MNEMQTRMNRAFDNYIQVTKCLQADGHHILNSDARTDSYCRNVIRCMASVIEGYNNCLYEIAVIGYDGREHLGFEFSGKESKVLSDPQKCSVPDRLKYTLTALRKMLTLPEINFGTEDWALTQKALRIRNDLVHPKTIEDLQFTDEPFERYRDGLAWIFKQQCETIEIMVERAMTGTLVR